MSDPMRAQLYLALEAAEAERLEALLRSASPACVRLAIAGPDAEPVAASCRALCHAADLPLVLSGPEEVALAVAKAVGADGIHLTGTPKAAPWVRRELGDNCIVGIAPGPSRHDALIAAEAGADYVSLGPDWATDGTVPEEIVWWAAMIETPMVVEGAATAERARTLRGLADFVAAGPEEAEAVAAALTDA